MRLSRAPFALSLLLLCAAASVPAQASPISIEVSGILGPLLSGIDPLHMANVAFQLTGSIPKNTTPSSITSDSATYDIPGSLLITLGVLKPVGSDAVLTLTDPASGPDTIELDFTASEFGFSPSIFATMILPEGTLKGTGLQNLTAAFSQPDSTLSFTTIGVSSVIDGTVGLTGTLSFQKGSPSGVPEPGTMGLLLIGMACLGRFASMKARPKTL